MTAGIESQPRTVEVRDRRALSMSMSHLGNRLQHLLERDAPLEASQWCAEAEVGAAPERQVAARFAVDVEPVRVVEVALVAVRRGEHQQQRAARRHGLALILDVFGDVAGDMRPGWLIAQQLLDRVRDQRPVLDEFRRWSGCSPSTLPIHPNRRPVVSTPAPAMTAKKISSSSLVKRRIVPVSSSNSTFSSSVIRSSDGFFFRQATYSANMSPSKYRSFFTGNGSPGLLRSTRCACGAHRRLIRIGDADQHADGPHRQFGAEVPNEVEPVAADDRVQACDAERPDLVLELPHLLRREGPRHEGPVDGVQRGVLVDEHARRHDRIRLDHFEDVALGRAEPVGLPQRGVDVGVSAQSPRSRDARCSRAAPRPAVA